MKLNKLLQEKKKRENIPDLLSCCFQEQRAFILDPNKRKGVFCPRRAGKSWALAVSLIFYALQFAKTKSLYFGLTEDSAKNVMWMNTVEVILNRFDIKYDATMKPLVITFENGSTIKFTGADATPQQINKALGGKYKNVVFDECQDIQHDLKSWIEDKLGPAMIDYGGTITCAGTAGSLMGERFWYQLTKQDAPRLGGWSISEWTAFDNISQDEDGYTIAQKMQDFLAEQRKITPGIELTPGYRQQYLNQWVVETDARIYKYNSAKNSLKDTDIIDSLLKKDPKWKYIFGMDYGYEDDTTLIVGAYSKHDPNSYIVETFKKPKMTTQDIAETIIEWKLKYKPVFIVGDCQNKTLIETLRSQYRIPITPAQKLGKFAHIAAMNSDFLTGRIKVIESLNKPLIEEWNELTWDEKKRLLGNYVENQSKDNHAADAALYLHHFSKHYRATPEEIITEEEYRHQVAEKRLKIDLMNNNELNIYENYDIAEFVNDYKRNM